MGSGGVFKRRCLRRHRFSAEGWPGLGEQRSDSFDLDEMHRLSGRYYPHGEYDARPGTVLPSLDVYKLGDRYYVVDGHHRVAAAPSLGQVEMEATVTEYTPIRYM